MEFMGKILRGEKQVFQNFEVCPYKVKYPGIITVKAVLKEVEKVSCILSYLPERPDIHVNRDYLFTIVNTADPSYFPRVVAEVERSRAGKVGRKQKTITISKDMHDLLEKFTDFNLEHGSIKSVSGLAMGAKKRTITQAKRQTEFHVRLDLDQDRRQRNFDVFHRQTTRRYND